MNKRALFILAITPLLLTACTKKEAAKDKSNEQATQMEQEKTTNNSMTGTLGSLLGLGKNLQCTFAYRDETTFSQGTVYVAGERMRGNFNTTIDETEYGSHMISTNQKVYVWNDEQTQGIVMDAANPDEVDLPDVDIGTDTNTSNDVDFNKDYDYQCDTWIPDNKMFEIPAEIEFINIQEKMENIQSEVINKLDIECSACDSLSGDSKTQCLAAIGC